MTYRFESRIVIRRSTALTDDRTGPRVPLDFIYPHCAGLGMPVVEGGGIVATALS